MTQQYDPQNLEMRWNGIWEKEACFQVKNAGDKHKYILEMFPYPSGKIHMGHVRNYTIGDVIARYYNNLGFNVLHPMGYDAFGLPAENAAIERGLDPADWTNKNIAETRDALKRMGFSYDWTKELSTCSPEYYKFTQWLFLKLYEHGLVDKREASVNWDPIDQTVLANEQVDAEGRSWRSGAIVEKKKLSQWFIKITKYADELLADIDNLKSWPENVRTMQRNWIGKAFGANIVFPGGDLPDIKAFTTRPDTVMGVTYVVIAPEHQETDKFITSDQKEKVDKFLKEVRKLKEHERVAENKEKKGVFTGSFVKHPFSGENIPVWIGDYVLADYGTGMVMGVPAHDTRDFKFAKLNGLEIKMVIKPEIEHDFEEDAWTGPGTMVNSGEFNGLASEEGKKSVANALANKNLGGQEITFKLRDWLISRQRYWGCPIPVIHCGDCGPVSVPYSELPVELPKDLKLTGKGLSPLLSAEKWLNVNCPKCKHPAKRETDTMDTFMCSSWYFLRYPNPSNDQEPFNEESLKWLSVDHYVGGVEHAILHLLYSRFVTHFVHDKLGSKFKEPCDHLLTQGMVCKETYSITKEDDGKKEVSYFSPDQVEEKEGLYYLKNSDTKVNRGRSEKMSKSKNNGIEPKALIDKYGADTIRVYTLFTAPPEKSLEWDDRAVEGSFRFLGRLFRLSHFETSLENSDKKAFKLVNTELHRCIKKVKLDIEKMQFHTAVAIQMEFLNTLQSQWKNLSQKDLDKIVLTLSILLNPFAPHLAEDIWSRKGGSGLVAKAIFPKYDESLLSSETCTIVVQVNGKLRAKIEAEKGISKEQILENAKSLENVNKFLSGGQIVKVIFVPDRLLNLVVRPV